MTDLITDKIEPFYLEGTIREENIDQEKDRVEAFTRMSMLDEGYVEVLDIDPQWTLHYDFQKNVFDFKLTMYGVEVEEAWRYSGWMSGQLIERSTPKPK